MAFNSKSGQVALIVILIMTVILTIGLSLSSRTITDIKITTDEKEALRAFSAAEAGIEEALRQDLTVYSGGSIDLDTGLSANITVEEVGGEIETYIEKDDGYSIILAGMPASNNARLRIFWVKGANPDDLVTKASLEITIYASDNTFRRFAYNPRGVVGRNNNFTPANAGDVDFENQTINIPINTTTDVLVMIRALYGGTTIKANTLGGTSLPTQSYQITSVVEAENEKIGRVEAERTVPVLPPIFEYVLFSNEGSL